MAMRPGMSPLCEDCGATSCGARRRRASSGWHLDKVRVLEPAPLGKARRRDPQDDAYLTGSLFARAPVITYDYDQVDLGQPVGLEGPRPSVFLKRLGG